MRWKPAQLTTQTVSKLLAVAGASKTIHDLRFAVVDLLKGGVASDEDIRTAFDREIRIIAGPKGVTLSLKLPS